MSDRINPSIYFDSQLALEEGRYLRYALFCLGNFLVWTAIIAAIVPLFGLICAVPIQGFFEFLHWLESAEWLGYDWAWLLGDDTVAELTSTPNIGLNAVARWLLNTWISIPFSVVGLFIMSRFN